MGLCLLLWGTRRRRHRTFADGSSCRAGTGAGGGNDTSKSTGSSGRQKAATRRNMRREERVTVQGPVKEQQPDGMSHRGVIIPTASVLVFEGIMLWTFSMHKEAFPGHYFIHIYNRTS